MQCLTLSSRLTRVQMQFEERLVLNAMALGLGEVTKLSRILRPIVPLIPSNRGICRLQLTTVDVWRLTTPVIVGLGARRRNDMPIWERLVGLLNCNWRAFVVLVYVPVALRLTSMKL